MLVFAALWWAWSVYAWLTSAMDVDEGGVRLAMLASTAAMFGVALAVPGAFGDDAVLFGVAYLLVRLLHLVLSAIVVGDDSQIMLLFRTMGRVFRRRTIAALVLLALIPAAVAIPTLAALALVSAVCSLLVAYKAIGRREYRVRVRHPELFE